MSTQYKPIPRVFFAADFMLAAKNGLTPDALVLALILQSHHARKTMYKSTNLPDLTGRDRKTLRGYLRKLREAGVVKEVYHPFRKDRILVARCPRTMLLWMDEREQAGETVNATFRAHLQAWIARVGDAVVCYKNQSDPIPWSCQENGRDGYFVEQLPPKEEKEMVKLARKHHTAIPIGLLTFRYLSFHARYVAIRLIGARCYTWEDHTKTMKKLNIGRTMFETAISNLREMGFVSGTNYRASKETRGINYNEACYREGHYALSMSSEGVRTNYELRAAAGLPVADVEPGDMTWMRLRLFVRELGESKAAFKANKKSCQLTVFEGPEPKNEFAQDAPLLKGTTANPTQEETPKSSCADAQRTLLFFPSPGEVDSERAQFKARLARMGHYLNERLPGARATIGNRLAAATRHKAVPGTVQTSSRRAKRIKAEIVNYPYAPGVQPPGADGNYMTEQLVSRFPSYHMQFIDWTPRLYDMVIRHCVLGEKLSKADKQYAARCRFNETMKEIEATDMDTPKQRRQWEYARYHGRPGWQTPPRLKNYTNNPAVREYFEDPSTLGNAFLVAYGGQSADHWTNAMLARVYRKILNGYINMDVVCRMRRMGIEFYRKDKYTPEFLMMQSTKFWVNWLIQEVGFAEREEVKNCFPYTLNNPYIAAKHIEVCQETPPLVVGFEGREVSLPVNSPAWEVLEAISSGRDGV